MERTSGRDHTLRHFDDAPAAAHSSSLRAARRRRRSLRCCEPVDSIFAIWEFLNFLLGGETPWFYLAVRQNNHHTVVLILCGHQLVSQPLLNRWRIGRNGSSLALSLVSRPPTNAGARFIIITISNKSYCFSVV